MLLLRSRLGLILLRTVSIPFPILALQIHQSVRGGKSPHILWSQQLERGWNLHLGRMVDGLEVHLVDLCACLKRWMIRLCDTICHSRDTICHRKVLSISRWYQRRETPARLRRIVDCFLAYRQSAVDAPGCRKDDGCRYRVQDNLERIRVFSLHRREYRHQTTKQEHYRRICPTRRVLHRCRQSRVQACCQRRQGWTYRSHPHYAR